MSFLAPSSLIFLAPWSLLAWWLITRRHQSQPVPFLELWRTAVSIAPKPNRRMRRPPMAILLLLLSTLLLVIAAARPIVRHVPERVAPLNATVNLQPLPAFSIIRASARTTPMPALMLTLRNDSTELRGSLSIREAEDRTTTHAIDLPRPGEQRNYFFDLAADSERVDVELATGEHIRLIRRNAPPRIDAIADLSPPLQRLIAIYARARPATERSPRVVVTDDLNKLPRENAGVAIVLPNRDSVASKNATPRIADHPITKNVQRWSALLDGAGVSSTAPLGAQGWSPVVSIDSSVFVAVRERPARQVWIGFASERFAHDPDFVIFWTDVFNWLGGGDLNDQDYVAVEPPRSTLSSPVSSTTQPAAPPGIAIAPILLVASLLSSLIAMLIWPIERR